MGVAENDDANMDFLRPEHIKTLMLVKIKAFGNMIRDTKDRTLELYHVRKQSASSDNPLKADEPMQEEEKKEPAQVNVNVNVIVSDDLAKKEPEPASESQAQTRIEFTQPP